MNSSGYSMLSSNPNTTLDIENMNNDGFGSRCSFFSKIDISQKVKALTNYVINNKVASVLGFITVGLTLKIIYDYALQYDVPREELLSQIKNHEKENAAYDKAAEQVFCFFKEKIVELLNNDYNATDSLEREFESLLSSLPKDAATRMNKTVALPCR